MKDKKRNIFSFNSGILLRLVIYTLSFIVFLIGVVFFIMVKQPAPKSYSLCPSGDAKSLVILPMPILSPGKLLQWAHKVAIETYTYNFVNYDESLGKLRSYFTEEGWDYFRNALELSGNVNEVVSKKLIVSAVSIGAPVVLERAIIGGRFSWKVQVPLLVSYQSPNEQIQKPIIVMMIISRVPTNKYPNGIAVASFIVTGGRSE